MKTSTKMATTVLGASLVVLYIPRAAFSQTEVIYPGSVIFFSSQRSSEGGRLECSLTGGNAFRHFAKANGWILQDTLISKAESGVNSAHEERREVWSYTTIHPKLKRMRQWLVVEKQEIDKSANTTRTTCSGNATLQGDRIDDTLALDIGIVIYGSPPQKGDQRFPINILRPSYCERQWSPEKKDFLETTQFDCKSFGIDVPNTIQQIENVGK